MNELDKEILEEGEVLDVETEETKPMELRDYQKECVNTVNGLPDGSKSIVCLATGLGKTVCGANFEFHGKMLWLSHRDELVRQPQKYFVMKGLKYGIEKAEEHAEPDCDVVSASIQSLSGDARLHSFDPNEFDMIICDEAQHAAAPTYRKVLSYFKPRKLIGLTATPKRGDGVRLTDVFDDICFKRDLRWGIENHYLAPIRCMLVESNLRLSEVKKTAGDYSAADLERAMQSSDNAKVVAKTYMEKCLPLHNQTIIYCPTVMTCEMVRDELHGMIPEEEYEAVAVVSGKTDPDERRQIIQDFRDEKLHCLINCMILTEGTDIPNVRTIVVDRPSCNPSLYTQIVGRGTRLYPGKEDCLVVDIVSKDFKSRDVCTAPTLFGINPDQLSSEVIKKLEKKNILEVADALALTSNRKKDFEIATMMIDFFTKERTDLIEENTEYVGIADAYRKQREEDKRKVEEETGISFGDLLVKIMPYDEKRYFIQPCYDGTIYLSKPNMINQTSIWIDIPPIDFKLKRENVPIDKAVSFVEAFCKYIMEDFKGVWSVDGRNQMVYRPSTEAQHQYIGHLYRDYEIKDEGMNCRQASDLIEMMKDLQKMGKRRKKLEKAEIDRNKKRRGKILEKWQKKQEVLEEEAKKAEEEYTRDVDKKLEWVYRIIKEGKEEEKKRREKIAQYCKPMVLNVPCEGAEMCPPKMDASVGQIRYINGLERDLKGHHYVFNRSFSSPYGNFTMRQASLIISALKYFKENMNFFDEVTIHVDSDAFLKEVEDMRSFLENEDNDLRKENLHLPYEGKLR